MRSMARWIALASLAAVAEPAAVAQPPENPECIAYRGEARYRVYGYDHIVIVDNRCERDARCTLSTDVDPDEKRVTVGAGRSHEERTRTGSPARAFTPRVRCTLEGGR